MNREEDLQAAERNGWKDVPLYVNNTGKVGFYVVTEKNGYLWLNVEDIPPKDIPPKKKRLTIPGWISRLWK